MCLDKKCRNIYSMGLTNIISKAENDLNKLLNQYDSAFKENRLNYNLMYNNNSSLTKLENDIDLLMKNLIQDSYEKLGITVDDVGTGTSMGVNVSSSSASASGTSSNQSIGSGEDPNNDPDNLTIVEQSQDVVFSRSEDVHFGYMRELIYFYTCIILCVAMVGFFMYELNKSTGIIDNVTNKAKQSLKNINDDKSRVSNQLSAKDNKINNAIGNKDIVTNNSLVSKPKPNPSILTNNINPR